MDRVTYGDPIIATMIAERFVPLRVDADERPDISERYGLGGWPTTAFLTPDGSIAGGGTFVAADRMAAVLEQVASAFDAHADRINVPAAASSPDGPALGDALAIDDLCAHVFETFDEDHGGFGLEPKFPLHAPLRLALSLWQAAPDARHEAIVVRSLDAMGWGGIYDEVHGGFFRSAARRDWSAPHTAKLLETNASLLRLYLDAGAALGNARFTERAADILRYVQTWLADPVDGGWASSQHAEDAGAQDAPRPSAPPVSVRLYADSNAVMASAALHAAGIFGDDGLRDFALKSLERVLLECYKPGSGVAHYHDGHHGVRGLLSDQVAMAAACLDAFAVTENIVYEMMAEELMHFAVRTMWNEHQGGFYDRAECPEDEAVGLMRTRLTPFVGNCEAAQVLTRLAATSGNPVFSERATAALDAVGSLAAAHGPLAAHYVLAVRDASVR